MQRGTLKEISGFRSRTKYYLRGPGVFFSPPFREAVSNLGQEDMTMTLDLERSDADFLKELAERPEAALVQACFVCRSCVAGCPISAVNRAFSPAKIIRMALLGLKEEVLKSDFLWLCATCYTCQERCPQGVRITDFMTLLKNMAIREGAAPPGIRAQLKLVTGEGRIYPIDDFDNKKRTKAGLPELPTACADIRKLFQGTDS